ncbi:hypothetical protein Y032_0061g3275 [Ancylostoma ceylanicum]|uniref:Uncharacterized protein n=1 Tax=Ancylostoma ceylanicum TaxID=53326 RepID=A0A016U3W2_9BILA|nr:hypothetical protein Y032_0061g3275 [Ancylostoma ceylanicum]
MCVRVFSIAVSGQVVKSCDRFGRWAGKSEGVYENPWGWTNFTVCFKMDFENVKVRVNDHLVVFVVCLNK